MSSSNRKHHDQNTHFDDDDDDDDGNDDDLMEVIAARAADVDIPQEAKTVPGDTELPTQDDPNRVAPTRSECRKGPPPAVAATDAPLQEDIQRSREDSEAAKLMEIVATRAAEATVDLDDDDLKGGVGAERTSAAARASRDVEGMDAGVHQGGTHQNQTEPVVQPSVLRRGERLPASNPRPGAFLAVPGVSLRQNDLFSANLLQANHRTTLVPPEIEDGIRQESQSQMLIEATLVQEDNVDTRRRDLLEERQYDPELLVHAEAVEGDAGVFGSKCNRSFAGLFLLAAVGLSLGLGLGLDGSDDAKEQTVFVNITEPPSPMPTSSPTMAPTPFLIQDLPDYSVEALNDPNSPQSRAYQWVRNDTLLQEYSNKRLLQRFALATIYYSTGGDDWINRELWLSYAHHECTWWTSIDETQYPEYTAENACWENEEFRYLTLWDNGLFGTVPPELGLLM